ncbi:hypothetical protein TREMEDRAFT_59660 [Tremella mesenterica DSM 1558]|uniref:uncharacterized protein n=1 Tax=Tremella mesenterica (strain ATCC 24925 / CBS 8224 / DSM 1558 / NBRC 9311 / NRRL Y-6157 / RJB 2259-6 / UBC 559-6) TaxID=578456 RepID=UPI0003F4950B|nr:uncharacterized protein TREMEDRAFT_59660 [Tremella mesenterica DSM 1558]EIW73486.1 hypothetical protein TREMEDRAFT_59660 [Tremella mesenterica DSM 1558]
MSSATVTQNQELPTWLDQELKIRYTSIQRMSDTKRQVEWETKVLEDVRVLCSHNLDDAWRAAWIRVQGRVGGWLRWLPPRKEDEVNIIDDRLRKILTSQNAHVRSVVIGTSVPLYPLDRLERVQRITYPLLRCLLSVERMRAPKELEILPDCVNVDQGSDTEVRFEVSKREDFGFLEIVVGWFRFEANPVFFSCQMSTKHVTVYDCPMSSKVRTLLEKVVCMLGLDNQEWGYLSSQVMKSYGCKHERAGLMWYLLHRRSRYFRLGSLSLLDGSGVAKNGTWSDKGREIVWKAAVKCIVEEAEYAGEVWKSIHKRMLQGGGHDFF